MDFEDRPVPVQYGRTRTERSFPNLPQPSPRFERRSAPPEPESNAEVPHLRYFCTALVSSCTIAGAIGALILAIREPAMLFVAAGVVLTVYFSLVILGKPADR